MSKIFFFILFSFTLMGCSDKKPKKPAPAAVVQDPWRNPNPDGDRYSQPCSGDQVKDTSTGSCVQRCPNGSAPSNGNCTQACSGGVQARYDGSCPTLGGSTGCAGQYTVQNNGARLQDGSGRYYYQVQNSTGIQVNSYECMTTDSNCQQRINSGQICTQVDTNGQCQAYDTRYNAQTNTANNGYTQGLNGAQTYTTTNINGQAIQAYQCHPSDNTCLQQYSNGNVCTSIDTNRYCQGYAQLAPGATRLGGTTVGGGGYNNCVGMTPAFDANTSIQSCYPPGTMLNQPGFSTNFGGINARLGFGQQGFNGNSGQSQGGLYYDPRSQFKGGYQQGSPSQMFQNNSYLGGVNAQYNTINNDPYLQAQLSTNQYPIMFSNSSAAHCQNYNRWLYQNMVLTVGADPCAYVYNAVSALVCAGKMVVQRIRPGINTVYEGHLSTVRQPPTKGQPYQEPANEPVAQTPIQSSPVQSGSGAKGGPPPLPPLPPLPGETPVPDQPAPQPAPSQPNGPVAKGQPAPVGQTVTKTQSSANKNCCVSRVCKIGGSFILSDRDQSCNGITVESVVSTQPITKPSDFPANSGETTINAQVIKDKDGTLKLQFFAIGPGEQIEITHFKYSSSQPVDLASSGPILFADVTWKTRTGVTCSVTNHSFAAVIYSTPKPIQGATCSKGGA